VALSRVSNSDHQNAPGPSTVSPSTVSPSTVSPSTVSPATVSPATVSPATVSPSTENPSNSTSRSDRRRRPTPMLSRYTFRGRRRAGRRAGERERVYVDRIHPAMLAAFLILLVLSAADAYFTLRFVSHGVQEANPLMRAALMSGQWAFVGVKMALTAVAMAFLTLHQNWRAGRVCVALCLACYSILMLYHLYGRVILGIS
jgi:hypothetical protein